MEKVKNQIQREEDDPETLHFRRIAYAFQYYRTHSMRRVLRAEQDYEELPAHHKDLIPDYKHKLSDISLCIERNYLIIQYILSFVDQMFENSHADFFQEQGSRPAPEHHMDKVKSTLKQIVRDWSAEGQAERDACYGPVIHQVTQLFQGDLKTRSKVKILVPGAGLGRLTWELARRGYTCQGNEFSVFMLFTSNFILNKCDIANSLTVYPWVHQYCNNRSNADQTRGVTFPDVNPTDLPSVEQEEPSEIPPFSMAAGDFLDVYTAPDMWDCLCTVFFIDTAHNVIDYIETIWKILKPGGYWINLGPLLYHFADMANERSIELTYEEVKSVIRKLNFEIVFEKEHIHASYTGNDRSMLQYQYDCVMFVARKPLHCDVTNQGSDDVTTQNNCDVSHQACHFADDDSRQSNGSETSVVLNTENSSIQNGITESCNDHATHKTSCTYLDEYKEHITDDEDMSTSETPNNPNEDTCNELTNPSSNEQAQNADVNASNQNCQSPDTNTCSDESKGEGHS